jgi:hypothetical protein
MIQSGRHQQSSEPEMSVVEIRLNPSDLSREMSEMRVWLDEHRFEASSFSCRHEEDRVLVCLEFAQALEAQAFANHFAIEQSARTAKPGDEPARGTLVTGLSPSGVVG